MKFIFFLNSLDQLLAIGMVAVSFTGATQLIASDPGNFQHGKRKAYRLTTVEKDEFKLSFLQSWTH